jgi:hypothetical protein
MVGCRRGELARIVDRYRDFILAWETRLNERDCNRVVRPLDWGLDWAARWPSLDGASAPAAASPESYLGHLNDSIIAASDEFFAYRPPADFSLAGDLLRFTSPVVTPCAANNLVAARWFPAGRTRAVIVLPQWNADAESHNNLCRIFNLLGISALRLSMPYHDVRKPAETERSDYAVSANISRTIDACRQAVIDARCGLDWLEAQGFRKLGIVGTSLGSAYAFITAAHDSRLRANVFNHCSSTFGDVVWTGQSTHHIRRGIAVDFDQERLRRVWMAISPLAYAGKYSRWPRQSLFIYALYDLTFLPEYSRQLIGEARRLGYDHTVRVLPCGHYTTGESPFKFLDAFYIASFLGSAMDNI